ncbi:MAG: hypothetical protein JNM88_20075, partial [Chitinophagaceae bacterium]|nr:hypothetical protein [Chitinophagaceae bacterium]
MNKRLYFTILMLSSTICGLAQSLSIPETVDYLNKILVQTPHREKIRPLKLYSETNYSYSDANRLERIRVISDSNRHVYVGCDVVTMLKCLIDKEGFLTFQSFVTTTNCDDPKNNVNNELRETYKINVDDID